jgi:hypothetical protein
MDVLFDDDLGRLTLRRLRPWHYLLAGCLAAQLDRELAEGARPEASPVLAARAMRLTSAKHRRDLAASLQRLTASPSFGVAGYQPHVPVRRTRVLRSAPELAELVGHLVQRGPVPVRGVAMVSQLLADGGGPLYRQACREDLSAIARRASQALSR